MDASEKELSTTQNILWNSIGSMIRLACNWLITVLVIRLTRGFDAGGALSLAMSVANLITPFSDFRLRTVQVTDITGEHTSGEYVGFRVLTSFSSLLIGALYALITCPISSFPVIALYLVQAVSASFIEASHAICQRHRRMDYIGVSYTLQGISNLAVFSTVLGLTNSLEYAVACMAIATILIAIFYSFPRAALFEPISPTIDLKAAIPPLLKLFPLVIAQVASSAVLTVPKQYLAVQYGDAALGIFSAIAAPTVIIQMGASYLYTPLIRIFAQRFNNDKRSALRLLRKVTLGIVFIAACSSLGFFLVGEPVMVLIFGERIRGNLDLLQPALACTFVTAICWFMNDLLLSLRDYPASFLGNAAAAAVALAATRPCVDLWQQNGVSVVGIVAYLTGTLILICFLVRDYRRLDS